MKKLSARQIFERSITEKDVFLACRQLLELNGARLWPIKERVPTCVRAGCGHYLSDHRGRWCHKCRCPKFIGSTSEPGMPDSLGWFPHPAPLAINFYIEFKKPGGARRPAQERWIAQARADGVIAFFADSVDAMVKGFAEFGIKIRGI